ncbi:hypothetical protein GCM10023231_17830 [Olivibacter ginsenosidimutans]|uniref:UspA domain-containing protein n=1 Tax=Olivibacter ginsenosidimutans TaxID=1176537 RepID=A0ABP9B5V4_9SPHI
MKTILIPIDFSSATQHVLNYVAYASKDVEIMRIILLISTYTSIYQQIIFSAEYMCLNEHNVETERKGIVSHLEDLSHKFSERVNITTKVEKAITELPLINAINRLIAQEDPDLLILNSDQSDVKSGYIGKNVIAIVKASTVPTLVIPSNAHYQTFQTALVPIDFQELDRLTVFRQPLAVTSHISPFLKVLDITGRGDFQREKQNLSRLLTGFSFEAYQTENSDILEGIMGFIRQHDLQLIIALPGKYNFFKRLTHKSITQTIALKSDLPVLILKQP